MINRSTKAVWFALLVVLAGAAAMVDEQGFVDKFEVPPGDFATTGRNDYFILEPGYQHLYEGIDGGKTERLVITVLDDTKIIDGVETRVIEERESQDDQLVEVSRNFFAIDKTNGNIYYFGEEVDEYTGGKVSGHPGEWHSGVNGARYGLFMPAAPKVGQKFYQEMAPKVAMDRVEIASMNEAVEVPAGRFENCLKTFETTPLEPGGIEHKLYAPKVGLIVDGPKHLVPKRR